MIHFNDHLLLYLGVFFLLLWQSMTLLVILYLLSQVRPIALQLEYVAGTSDMVMDAQKEQTKLIVALLENS